MEKARREIRVHDLGQPFSHYTDAVQWGDLAFISGCVALDRNGALVGNDARSQARRVLENMTLVLDSLGTGLENVLKVTVYLTDIRDREEINSVRSEFFGTARPASTLVQVASLVVPGLRVEIDAVAAIT
jgi:reactive intermediate/imine deaminase